MNNFSYHIPTEIYFGKGQIKQLVRELPKYGRKVLLVYGGGSIKKTGVYAAVKAALEKAGVQAVELSGVEPNPRIDTVRAGARLCRGEGVEAVLAVGGGSSIDCAKVIAAAAKYEGDPWDLVTGTAPIEAALPILTVVTLAATGSEMDRYAVISNPATNEKLGSFSPLYHPRVSILDPEYTCSVPAAQTAAGTADIMSHVLEFYFNRVPGAFLQNRLSEGLLKTCIHYGPVALREPDNYEARANLLWSSSLAIDGVTWRGNEVASTVHPMEHELSAFYDITHGVGLAILTPHWMRHVLREDTLERFVEYGLNVWGVDPSLEEQEIARQGIEKTAAFFRRLELPATLTQVGIDDRNFELMAQRVARKLRRAFVPLTQDEVEAIYRAAL